ncbi:CDP-glycerol glycerophosphotransferase family protein [uncultured Agrococcus sp.]|uniref:CDP-glycerol glycerophosphotransferase family protein n=1 Tax=uncultured Agrococcus sp. TaxID=382258 RepID=UPI0025FAEA26|nr:CDP-glycerol glycerophosphotransferase family protein [uncultured Agrococcus sp.]
MEIVWERIHMTIRMRLSSPLDAPESAASEVSFAVEQPSRVFPVNSTDEGDGAFAVHINITTFADRKAIPNGVWRVRAYFGDAPGPAASFDGGALTYLDEASRVFHFDSNRSALTVSFGVEEPYDDAPRLDFLIMAYQLALAPGSPDGTSAFAAAKRALFGQDAKRRYARWIYNIVARIVGPKKGRILFASDQQPSMEGNLRRVHERMLERGLDKRFDMRYSFRLPGTTGWGATSRILYLMATSEIILLDDYFGLLNSVTVSRRSRIIQLWHAGVGFKAVGFSRFGRSDSPKLSQPHRQYTYAICGSEHLRHVYAEAFGIEESAVIPTGLPRVDWFLDEERTAGFVTEFYDEYPHLRSKRIILFAPTFRGSSYHAATYDYGLIDLAALYEACGQDTAVLFRMHPFVKDAIDIPQEFQDRFFDFTKYEDGLGLLHVTDLLITDYSSVIYEYSLLDRPMLFFAPDRVNYAATRGFHHDYVDTAPGRVCATFNEVIDAIATCEFEQEKVARFRAENFDRIDTGSADRVIDWLIDDQSSAAGSAEARTDGER